jgi:hypothetical protein
MTAGAWCAAATRTAGEPVVRSEGRRDDGARQAPGEWSLEDDQVSWPLPDRLAGAEVATTRCRVGRRA